MFGNSPTTEENTKLIQDLLAVRKPNSTKTEWMIIHKNVKTEK